MIKLLSNTLLISVLFPHYATSFSPSVTAPRNIRPSTPLFATKQNYEQYPEYDNIAQEWVITSPDQEESYGPIGSLLRGGPYSIIKRCVDPYIYDQSVLKYMATDRCDRQEAQGNIDAFNRNPNDWTYRKLQEKAGKLKKKDFGKLEGQSAVLAVTWAIGVTGTLGYLAAESARIMENR